jgi:hypothetical protein
VSTTGDVTALDVEPAYAALAELLAAGRQGRFHALTLTDEEMAVLAVDTEDLTPRPWWEGIRAGQRELAQAVALRGLVARRLVSPVEVDVVTATADLVVDDLVLAVLGDRRAASDLVLEQRRSEQASWFLAIYGQGDAGALEEHVSPGGLHEFWFSGREHLPGVLATYVDPQGVAPQDGDGDREVRRIDLARVATGEATVADESDARLVSVVSAVDPDDTQEADRFTVLAYEDRAELARTPADGHEVVVTLTSRPALRAACAALLDAARSA